jgi:hypothetical protein
MRRLFALVAMPTDLAITRLIDIAVRGGSEARKEIAAEERRRMRAARRAARAIEAAAMKTRGSHYIGRMKG